MSDDARDVLLRRVRAYVATHHDSPEDRTLSPFAAMEVINGWTPTGTDEAIRRTALRAVEELARLADANARGKDSSPDARLARAVLEISEEEHSELDDSAFMHALALWLMYVERGSHSAVDDLGAPGRERFDEELRDWLDGDCR